VADRRCPTTSKADLTAWLDGCAQVRRASVLLADEGVRMSVVGLRWPMPLPIDDMVGEDSSAR
jgi:hypothetical protein